MKVKLIGDPKIVMSNPKSHHNYFAWPTVARLQDGKIVVGASGFRLQHICPFGKAVISYSFDEGEHFTPPAPVIDTPLDDRDVGLCPFGEHGLIFTSFNNAADFQKKFNTGNDYVQRYLERVTKEEEAACLGSHFCISRDDGITFGDLIPSPVTSPHGPTALKNGNILWVGNRFDDFSANLAVVRIDPETGSSEFVGEIRSDDPDLILCEPHMIELPDGRLLCHIRGEGKGWFTVYQSVSEDGGKNWTKPEMILDETAGSPPHLLLLSSGEILSVYGRRTAPCGIMAAVSTDGGKSWEKDLRIYRAMTDVWDLGYPATVEGKDGSLLTVFYAPISENGPCVIFGQKWCLEE